MVTLVPAAKPALNVLLNNSKSSQVFTTLAVSTLKRLFFALSAPTATCTGRSTPLVARLVSRW